MSLAVTSPADALDVPFPFSLLSGARRAARHVHVVMINGGGTREQNYQSHLLHLQQLLQVLLQAKVPRDNVTLFSGDGADPADDLAIRDPQPEAEFWRLRGTGLASMLNTQVTYANSTIAGFALAPATRAAVRAWFADAASHLHAGDTLLLYVTDHGTKDAADPQNNRIVLWGKDEALSVAELHALLGGLPRGVHVVLLMSQCFSGAFASLMYDGAAPALPSGAVCGYFSSTADRPAYGCYPENRGKENIGHSFDFIRALETGDTFPQAHAQVLVTDRTPDVPLQTSDVYLSDLLQRVAQARGQEPAEVVDELLRQAWRDKAAWEPEIRLLDRTAHAVGYFSPRSLAELSAQSQLLPPIADQLRTYADAWNGALAALAQQNLARFLVAQPAWQQRLAATQLQGLDAAARRATTAALLADLVPFTRAAADPDGLAPASVLDSNTEARLRVLKDKADSAAAASYRMQVRLGVVLRMRAVLTAIAGRVYLATAGSDTERTAYEALRRCEDFRLATASHAAAVPADGADPFPSYDDEVHLTHRISPAWMGIRFKQANPTLRRERQLHDGAAAVVAVFPDSPAAAAGLQVGDVIIGPQGSPFVEPYQIREWTMRSAVDEALSIDVLRDRKRLHVALVPKPFPLTWPELPAAPTVGSAAPALKVDAFRGRIPSSLANGTPHLLFFWATWCLHCKAALPEVLAFEREHKVPVIAITDELPEQLQSFFAKFTDGFPQIVATDEYRRSFVAYGVSGTPTFVLIDGQGIIRSYAVGYSATTGLPIDGWTWSGRTAKAGAAR